MQAVERIKSPTVVIATRDIDTDQIIPARFLTATTREGFGEKLFYDLRFDADGNPNEDFPLNHPLAKGAKILVAGRNFGCGSSREHAPWALTDFGIAAVISTEIADIFRSNALKNRLIPVVVDEGTHDWLLANPGAEVEIDVVECSVKLPDGRSVAFPIDAFARHCLLEGIDQLGYLHKNEAAIRRFEENRPWKP